MKDAGLLEVVAKFIPLFCELHPGLDSEESLRLQTSSWEFLAVLGSPRLLVPSQDPNVPGPHTVVPAQIWRQLLKALAWFCTHFSPRALCDPVSPGDSKASRSHSRAEIWLISHRILFLLIIAP